MGGRNKKKIVNLNVLLNSPFVTFWIINFFNQHHMRKLKKLTI